MYPALLSYFPNSLLVFMGCNETSVQFHLLLIFLYIHSSMANVYEPHWIWIIRSDFRTYLTTKQTMVTAKQKIQYNNTPQQYQNRAINFFLLYKHRTRCKWERKRKRKKNRKREVSRKIRAQKICCKLVLFTHTEKHDNNIYTRTDIVWWPISHIQMYTSIHEHGQTYAYSGIHIHRTYTCTVYVMCCCSSVCDKAQQQQHWRHIASIINHTYTHRRQVFQTLS